MKEIWESIGIHKHPEDKGILGHVVKLESGIYAFKVKGSMMCCPQDWASKIYNYESQIINDD